MRSRLAAATVLVSGTLLLTGCAVKVPGSAVAAESPAAPTTTTTTTTYPVPNTSNAGYAAAAKLPAGFPLAPGTTVPYAHDDGKTIVGQLRVAGGYAYYRTALRASGYSITFSGTRKATAPAGTPDALIDFTGNGFASCRMMFTGDSVIFRFQRA